MARFRTDARFGANANGVLSQMGTLNPNDPSLWPRTFQYVLCALVMLAVAFAGWFFFVSEMENQISAGRNKEEQLKNDITSKVVIANRLASFREEKETLEQVLIAVEKQLPSRAEMDVLLTDVYEAGRSANLQFDVFRPAAPVVKDFYIEQHITIELKGTFENIVAFYSRVNLMSRIIKIDDFTITQNKNSNVLSMRAVVKIFSYKTGANKQEGADDAAETN